MEYCAGGDMSSLLKQCKKDNDFIGESTIWKMFGQIMFALHECHHGKRESGGKILHRDLKPANIFFDAAKNVKLGDFGLSRVMGEHSVFATTNVGTPFYMSPEQIGDAKYDEKSDIWSAGCLLYEMAALRPPFHAQNHLQLAIKIKDGRFDRIPMRYSEDLQSLIESMLHAEPSKRPSCAQIIEMAPIAWPQKERKQRERAAELKAKDEEITKKNAILSAKEATLEERETLMNHMREAQRQLELEIIALESKSVSPSCLFSKHSTNQLMQHAPAEQPIDAKPINCLVKEGGNSSNIHSTSNLNTSCSKSSHSFASTNNTFEIKKDPFIPTLPQSLANSQPYNNSSNNQHSKREKYCSQEYENPSDQTKSTPTNTTGTGTVFSPSVDGITLVTTPSTAAGVIAEISASKQKHLSQQQQQNILALVRNSSSKELKHASNEITTCSPVQLIQQQQFQQNPSSLHFKSVNNNINNNNSCLHSDSATPSTEKDTATTTTTTTGRNTIPSLPSSAREPTSGNKYAPSQFISTSTDKDHHCSTGSYIHTNSSEKRTHNRSINESITPTHQNTIDETTSYVSPSRAVAATLPTGINHPQLKQIQPPAAESLKLRTKFSSHESLQLQQQQKQLILLQQEKRLAGNNTTMNSTIESAATTNPHDQPYFSRPRAVNSIDSTSYRNTPNATIIDAKFSYLGYVRQQQSQQSNIQQPPQSQQIYQQQFQSIERIPSQQSCEQKQQSAPTPVAPTRYNSAGRYSTNVESTQQPRAAGQKSHNQSIQINESDRQVNACRSDAILAKKPQSTSLNRQSSEGSNTNNQNPPLQQQQQSSKIQYQQSQSNSTANQRVPLSAQLHQKSFAEYQYQQQQSQQSSSQRTMHSRANSSNGSTGAHLHLNRLLEHHSAGAATGSTNSTDSSTPQSSTATTMSNTSMTLPLRKKPAPIPPHQAAYLNTNSSYQSSAVPPLPASTRGHSTTLVDQRANSGSTLTEKRKDVPAQQQSTQPTPAPIPSRSRLIPPSIESTMQQQQQYPARTTYNQHIQSAAESITKQQSDSLAQARKFNNMPLSNIPTQQQYRSSTPVHSQSQLMVDVKRS